MELQTSDFPQEEIRCLSTARSTDSPAASTQHSQLSASLPILRFPRPQGSQHLATWISSSSPDIMPPSNMSDTSSLAESAYEIIHGTDTESQDGRLTESIGSLSVSRPEDVHSLDGSENHYNTDSDDGSTHSSHASAIQYADQALQNPSAQPSTASLEYGSSTEGSGVVVGPIEFQEAGDDSVVPERISVKHAIREYSEAESAVLAQHLCLEHAPRRLVSSIRQTMSQSYLSTQEPLRVLYVGRTEAQRSVVLKICSAMWASPKDGSDDSDHFSRHREGVYNIVPISSFGPAPELDLMEASHYQIKVEHCTSAEFLRDDVYSISIDQAKAYSSCMAPSGPFVQPNWDLPHVAIFYCSAGDDLDAERTREAAWSFMKRHGVPSIFIAEEQMYLSPVTSEWCDYIDEHTVHLSLESRDDERPMTPRRFPIDFASLADIDARQLNRHLAYLTGLSESEDEALDGSTMSTGSLPDLVVLEEHYPFSGTTRALSKTLERINAKKWALSLLVPLVLSLLAPFFFSLFSGWLRSGDPSHLQAPGTSGVCVPPTHPGALTTSRSAAAATTTTTVVINVTSTKTVQVSQAKPSTSTLASALSFAGFISDKPSVAPADPETKKPANATKKGGCSVRIYSPNEFLVEIPCRNKAQWLAQGAIDIDVRRGNESVKTKISAIDEGVLVELARADARGVLDISVVTTRRPKINETFQVDFGRPASVEALHAALQSFQEAVKRVSASVGGASQLIDEARKLQEEALSALEQASEAARNRTAGKIKRAADSVLAHLTRQLQSAETIRKEVDLSVLQAQITSKLWWLRFQGRTEEYAAYAKNASRFLKTKHEELLKGRKVKDESEPREARSLFGLRGKMHWRCGAECGRRGEKAHGKEARRAGWNGKWKKLMGGV